MAKYAGVGASPSLGPSSAVQPPPPTSSVSNPESQTHSVAETPAAMSEVDVKHYIDMPSQYMRLILALTNLYKYIYIDKREAASMSPNPEDFALAKDDEEDARITVQVVQGDAEQVFAADYDPSQDRREDEQRRVRVANEMPMEVVEEEEEEADIDDMFAVATGEKKVTKIKKVVVRVVITF